MLTRRLSTTFLTLLAAVLTTAGLGLVWAGPAQAHSELISSTPGDRDELYEPPTQVVLEFNETIQDIGNEIVITGPDGSDIAEGDPQIQDRTVTQALVAPTSTGPLDIGGDYTVTWRVVSADGHPISGAFTFEVLLNTWDDVIEETTTEETTPEATETSVAPSSIDAEEDDTETGMGAALPIVVGLAALALVAVVVLVVRRRRAR